MTHRERIMAVIEGRSPDRIPWVPRLLLWYKAHKKNGTLPDKYQDWSLRDIERDLGIGTPARDGRVFSSTMKNVETKVHRRHGEVLIEYITPVGTVRTKQITTPELEKSDIGGREVERMIKSTEDYDVVEYIMEHTEFVPAYDEYLAYEKKIGEDGVPLVSVGACPMHRILREFLGYEKAYLELHDHPQKIENLLTVMTDRAKEMQKIVAESPAKMILHGVHFDSMMTPPPIFEKYFKPYFQEFSKLLHSKGKILVCHADADTKLLLRVVIESGFDMAETFTTYPMVSCTLAEAREVWGNKVIIWGGVPSVILCESFSDEEFESFMLDLFKTIAPGDSFILGVADNVMPETKFERIVRISEMVETHGKYPIQV